MKTFSKILQIFTIIIILIIIASCRKKEEYPVVPAIKIKSFTVTPIGNVAGDECSLVLTFTDGDGDIGSNDQIANSYDMFIDCLEKKDGKYEQAYNYDNSSGTYIPITFNSRLPEVIAQGKNKNITGDISYDFSIYNPLSKFDTIAFQIYITDRAKNKSNVVMTNDVIF